MVTTGLHLLQLTAFLLLFCISATQGTPSRGRHDEMWTSINTDKVRGYSGKSLISKSSHRISTTTSKKLPEAVSGLVPIDRPRKPYDRFIWPWKNYEDWKRHQKKLEDEIDRMLKPRNRRYHTKRGSKRIESTKRRKYKPSETQMKPLRKKKQKKKKKVSQQLIKLNYVEMTKSHGLPTSTDGTTFLPSSTHHPFEVFPSGGVVLSVKYYSTNEVSSNNTYLNAV